MSYELKYKAPGPVLASFIKHRPEPLGLDLTSLDDEAYAEAEAKWPIDIIEGPIGSGKTAGCGIRMFLHGCEQPVSKDGWRRTRWAVIRNTFDELKRTTIPSWLEWFPEEHFGPFNWSPPYCHRLKLPGIKMEMEVWFVPCDDAAAVKKLLSWNLTGAYINEGREVPREVVIAIRSRCGRYPSLKDLADPNALGWAGVLMDTNTPEDELHYLCMWSGRTEPPEWMDAASRTLMGKPAEVSFFMQPPGMVVQYGEKGEIEGFKPNPKAENLRNLRPGYYRGQLAGNTTAWVLNMCCCEVRKAADLRLVYPTFNAKVHVAARHLEYDPSKPLLIGGDFARNPAFIVGQEAEGQLRILREFCGSNIDVAAFVERTVVPSMNVLFPGWQDRTPRGWGDPTGGNRTGGDDSTAFLHAKEGGLLLHKCWTNDPDERQRAVTRRLERSIGGAPALIIDPRCTMLIGGFKGGYRFERKKVEGSVDEYKDEPKKDMFSHPQDGLQYLACGLDRGSRVTDEHLREQARRGGPGPNGRVKVDPLSRRQVSAFGRNRFDPLARRR